MVVAFNILTKTQKELKVNSKPYINILDTTIPLKLKKN